MMREIKFRGLPTCKDKDELDYINFDRDGNFAVGFYEDGYIIGKVADANDEYISPEFWVAVDRNTVGQYTGLHDAGGQEIYECDIITGKYPNEQEFYGQVFYDEMTQSYKVRTREYWLPSPLAMCHNCEVIGNIYENPELMEVAEHDED